ICGPHFPLHAVVHALEKYRPPIPRANSRRRLFDSVVDAQHIILRNPLGWHAVGAGAFADIVALLAAQEVSVYRVEIVLANENNGQRLEGRKIHAFMKNPFIHGAVAEKAYDDGIFAL